MYHESRILFHLVFILIIVPSLYSQEAFSPGYVILNSGDTLHGQVRDRDLSRDAIFKKVRFREEHHGTKRYGPYDIEGYRIGDIEFDSRWFEEEAEFFKFFYFCRAGVGEKTFLKVLERGELTCYYREYIDPDSGYPDGYELFQRAGEDHFERATQGILGLKMKRLSAYFADCPSLVRQINNGEIRTPGEMAD
ncbi:MAG: hypothetical protein EHM46_06135, partial [Bacteroidetes bacterium]